VLSVDHAKTLFKRVYSGDPQILVRSPGRVELIGGHTDYNDGYVLPMAIDLSCYIAAARRSDRQVRLYSELFDQNYQFSLDATLQPSQGHWANYCKGIAALLLQAGVELLGLDMTIACDIPSGGGLSSSATIEVAYARAFLAGCGHQESFDPVELALLCRQAEHTFAGTPCGIMDQFICCLARKDHALLLDCRSREYRHVPFPADDANLVVADTRVKHQLASSEYPLRVRQCQQVVKYLIDQGEEISALRDVSSKMLDRYADKLDKVLLGRARHIASENQRVLQMAQALAQQDIATAGAIMSEAHESISKDYQVSCPELDFLAAYGQKLSGVYGARMSGGGFGGCVVMLVENNRHQEIEQQLVKAYVECFGRECGVFHTAPARSAEVLMA